MSSPAAMEPSYRSLHRRGELAARASRARKMMESCRLCPRDCRVDRGGGQLGFCRAGATPRVYKYKVHFGEEPPISGTRGSGVVFFSHCTLQCIYCQNTPMSHHGLGYTLTSEKLADIFLALQHSGCHNLNLVTATHFLPAILEALSFAAEQGLRLPIVYNTSGYETLEVLRLLEGIVDIYLPDMKYARGDIAKRYSSAPRYPQVNVRAVEEMFRQVGHLAVDHDGVAVRGLIIRHLILPHDLASTRRVMNIIAEQISPRVHVSLMSQYLPVWAARQDRLLGRRISPREYRAALEALEGAGLNRGWVQELSETDQSGAKTG